MRTAALEGTRPDGWLQNMLLRSEVPTVVRRAAVRPVAAVGDPVLYTSGDGPARAVRPFDGHGATRMCGL